MLFSIIVIFVGYGLIAYISTPRGATLEVKKRMVTGWLVISSLLTVLITVLSRNPGGYGLLIGAVMVAGIFIYNVTRRR